MKTEIVDISLWDLDGKTIEEVIDLLQSRVDAATRRLCKDMIYAEVTTKASVDGEYTLCFRVSRPFTPEEQLEEDQRYLALKLWQHDHDRQIFEKLKAQYGW